jgi:hypothetical protein
VYVGQLRTNRIGTEREIKEMHVESGERRAVINYNGKNSKKKLYLQQQEKEKDEGRGETEKKNGGYIHHTNNENSSHCGQLLI